MPPALRDAVRAVGAELALVTLPFFDPAELVASRWDEHPNAAAHAESAEEIVRFLAALE